MNIIGETLIELTGTRVAIIPIHPGELYVCDRSIHPAEKCKPVAMYLSILLDDNMVRDAWYECIPCHERTIEDIDNGREIEL